MFCAGGSNQVASAGPTSREARVRPAGRRGSDRIGSGQGPRAVERRRIVQYPPVRGDSAAIGDHRLGRARAAGGVAGWRACRPTPGWSRRRRAVDHGTVAATFPEPAPGRGGARGSWSAPRSSPRTATRSVGYALAYPPGAKAGARLPVAWSCTAAGADYRRPFDGLRLPSAAGRRRWRPGYRPFVLASVDGGREPGGIRRPAGMTRSACCCDRLSGGAGPARPAGPDLRGVRVFDGRVRGPAGGDRGAEAVRRGGGAVAPASAGTTTTPTRPTRPRSTPPPDWQSGATCARGRPTLRGSSGADRLRRVRLVHPGLKTLREQLPDPSVVAHRQGLPRRRVLAVGGAGAAPADRAMALTPQKRS